MGKKDLKKKKAAKEKPVSMSFEQAFQRAMKGAFEGGQAKQTIAVEISQQLNQMLPYIKRDILEGQKKMLLDILVQKDVIFELKPTLNDDSYAQLLKDKEDQLLGYEVVDGPAEEGHTLRIQVAHQAPETEFTNFQDGMIKSLNVPTQTGQTQMFPEVETALVGKKVGEEVVVEVLVDEQKKDEEGKLTSEIVKVGYNIKVKIDKIMISINEKIRRNTKADVEAAEQVEQELASEAPSEG